MKKDKKETTNELIIPEMEPLEDIKIEQTENIKKEDKEKEKETINVENDISENKSITNSQELLNLLNKSIKTMEQLQQECKVIYRDKSLTGSLIFDKYRFYMPILLDSRIGRRLSKFARFAFNTDKELSNKFNIREALSICIKFLKILKQDTKKSIVKRIPIFNDQHFFATDNEGTIINDNPKLDFLDRCERECKDICDSIHQYKFLKYDYNRDLDALFGSLIEGLQGIKEYGFKRLKNFKSFSDLTIRLDQINRCL